MSPAPGSAEAVETASSAADPGGGAPALGPDGGGFPMSRSSSWDAFTRRFGSSGGLTTLASFFRFTSACMSVRRASSVRIRLSTCACSFRSATQIRSPSACWQRTIRLTEINIAPPTQPATAIMSRIAIPPCLMSAYLKMTDQAPHSPQGRHRHVDFAPRVVEKRPVTVHVVTHHGCRHHPHDQKGTDRYQRTPCPAHLVALHAKRR